MPRLARTVVGGRAHHITQRGNNRQDVFFVDDDRHFWLAMRYVELNPVRARLCRKAWRYEWSSAAAHVDGKGRSELLDLRSWYDMISAEQWRKELNAGIDEADVGRIRVNTHTGRPLGSDSFLSKLEKLLGRRVRSLPVGRPTKKRMKMSK
jgi:putative transposase